MEKTTLLNVRFCEYACSYPSLPKECLTAESMRTVIGLLEIEHDTSAAPTAKNPPANKTDGRVTMYRAIVAQNNFFLIKWEEGGGGNQ